jgi:hypothetical protein
MFQFKGVERNNYNNNHSNGIVFSGSQLDAYARCPAAYYFSYTTFSVI